MSGVWSPWFMRTQHTIIDTLESEWPVAASSSEARVQLAAWPIGEPDLAEFRTIGVLVTEVRLLDQHDLFAQDERRDVVKCRHASA